MRGIHRILTCLWILFSSLTLVSALALSRRDSAPKQARLRIVPLGDSITFGWWSSTNNGYRLALLQLLQKAGFDVEYIGFHNSGSMANNANEGWPGDTIDQIHHDGFEVFNGTFPLPNVVLLHAGTNDANQAASANGDAEAAATEMINDLRDLLADIWAHGPDICVIVAQIIMDQDPAVQAIIDRYNGYIPYLIRDFALQGQKIIGVSMSDIDLNGADHDGIWAYDPTHPGDPGFKKMANNFYFGVMAADNQSMISAPEGIFTPAEHASIGAIATNPSTVWASICDYNASWASPEQIFPGLGNVDTSFKQLWLTAQDFTKGIAGKSVGNNYVWLADFDADGLADYMLVHEDLGAIDIWRNVDGKGNWENLGNKAFGTTSTPGVGVIMSDVNGDGYADYVWQGPDGTLSLTSNYYTHGWASYQNSFAQGFKGTRGNTHIADITGDGRSDLIWIDANGINAWLNVATANDVAWSNAGLIGQGLGSADASDRFVDVDGDGRCDYVHINSDGSMDVWLNPDITGYGAAPSFVAAGRFKDAGYNNVTNIILADVDGDGRADHVVVDPDSGGLTVSLNKGSDGFGQIRFADANKDGRGDLFYINNAGDVRAWNSKVFDGFVSVGEPVISTGIGPRYVRLADINAVRYADVVVIDPSSCKLTAYPGKGDFTFGAATVIHDGPRPQGCKSCADIQFTDNNGDGRADVICVAGDATTWLTYNLPTVDVHSFSGINWTFFGWILINQGASGNQARFADLNGDGFDDVMTVNNQGGIHAFVSSTSAALFGGLQDFPDINTPYSQVLLTDLNSDGRADVVIVDPSSGAATAYLNRCVYKFDVDYPRDPSIPRDDAPGTSVSEGPSAPTLKPPGSTIPTGGDDGDDDGEEEDNGPSPDIPDCTASYKTLEDMDADAANVPNNCKGYYLVATLNVVFQDALTSYNDMITHGYDGKFNTYSNAVAGSAENTVRDWVDNHGNNYFSCIVTEEVPCCDYCKDESHPAQACKYCWTQGNCKKSCNSVGGPCSEKRRVPSIDGNGTADGTVSERETPHGVEVWIFKPFNETEPCPPDYSQRGAGSSDHEQSVYWTLRDDRADQFYADIFSDTSITKAKLGFRDYARSDSCVRATRGDGDDCWNTGWDFGMAAPVGYTAADVDNPKSVVQKALDNSNNLKQQIADAATNLQHYCYDGDAFELADSISLPVLMVAQAVETMANVETIANKIEEEKRKAIIMAFLGAIFFFIPVAGEVLGAVTELADIAAIMSVVGVAGNAALDIYTIATDPDNAPLAILDLILAPLALGDLAIVAKAARIQRGMKAEDVAKLGSKVAGRLGTIKKVMNACKA